MNHKNPKDPKSQMASIISKLGGAFGGPAIKTFEFRFKDGKTDFSFGTSVSDAWKTSGRNKEDIKTLESYREL